MTASLQPVLDLADLAPVASRREGRARAAICGVALLVAILIAAGVHWALSPVPVQRPTLHVSFGAPRSVEQLTVDDRTQILAEGEEAQTRNEAIPFAGGKVMAMRAFLLDAPASSEANALRCLTQAIYYEAATEPLEGRRAVAQVVLNRVRHPAYPKSVCGVVYQGSQQDTGCQFSFTCDGSLLRKPMAGPWKEAEEVAREALAGRVEPIVGTATHYHADYVLPRWAFEMAKVARLGRHLFYRFEGGWGRTSSFVGQYSGREMIPALDMDRLRARLFSGGAAAIEPIFAPGLTVSPTVTDRHADNDVGGRIDMTREWRPSVPDPTVAQSHYRELVGAEAPVQAGSTAAATEVHP